jgi:hypothetical protein
MWHFVLKVGNKNNLKVPFKIQPNHWLSVDPTEIMRCSDPAYVGWTRIRIIKKKKKKRENDNYQFYCAVAFSFNVEVPISCQLPPPVPLWVILDFFFNYWLYLNSLISSYYDWILCFWLAIYLFHTGRMSQKILDKSRVINNKIKKVAWLQPYMMKKTIFRGIFHLSSNTFRWSYLNGE